MRPAARGSHGGAAAGGDAVTGEKFQARMFELKHWLEASGLCGMCAIEVAMVQVERESGNVTIRANPSQRACRNTRLKDDGTGQVVSPSPCLDRARAVWRAMPVNQHWKLEEAA